MSLRAACGLLCLLIGLPAASPAGPAAKLPSLARINGLLDSARDLERKKSFAEVVPLYADVLKECGDPPPRHLQHVAAKALVMTGNAELAIGHLPEAQAAYQAAVTRFGAVYDDATRQHTLRARTLIKRVDELLRDMGKLPPSPAPASSTKTVAEKEPLILLTERKVELQNGTGTERGFEVRTFDGDEASLIRDAERKASPRARKVLETGRDMAVVRRVILPGSCWDWVNAVFTMAGFNEDKRTKTFKSKKKGPYLEVSQLQPGDWMYYLNHSYSDGEHSGIFVGWINGPSKVGLVLSYPGMNREEPGRYRPYELTSVYTITRPANI